MCRELIDYLSDNCKIANYIEENTFEDDLNPNKFISINISKYMNNKSFASNAANKEHANLSDSGCFYALKKTVNGILDYNGMNFNVKIDDKDCIYDNISCIEQFIDFKPDYYTHLLFIGCAQFGNQECTITINFIDGSELLPMKVSNWVSVSSFNEIIISENEAWKIVNELKNQYFTKANLFLQCIRLPSDKIITEIKLPYRPNVNLFSLGLLKK